MPDPKDNEKEYEQGEGESDVAELDILDVEETAEMERQPQRRDEEGEDKAPDDGRFEPEIDEDEPRIKRDGKIGGPD